VFFCERGTPVRHPFPDVEANHVPRRACPSLGGPIYPDAGPSVPRWGYPSRGGPIRPEAGLSVLGRARLEAGLEFEFVSPEAGLSVQRRTYQSRGATSSEALPVPRRYRGTSLIRNSPPHLGPP